MFFRKILGDLQYHMTKINKSSTNYKLYNCKLIFLILSFLLVLSNSLYAKGNHIERFNDWYLFKINKGQQKICYIMSLPIDKDSNVKQRGEPYFLIIGKKFDLEEINFSSGYNYKKNTNIEIIFNENDIISAFSHKNLAWAKSRDHDIDIIKKMSRNEDFIISSIHKNTKSFDRYSLVGFNKAYNALQKQCK